MKVYCRNGLIISLAFLMLSCASTQSHHSNEDQVGENSNNSDMEERAKMLIATSLQDEMQGNTDLAFQKRQEALELSRKIKHTGLEIMALVGIATTYMTQGNYSEALKLYQAAEKLIIERLGGETPTIVFILSSIGSVYEELGDFPNAIDYHKRAIEISNSTQGIKNEETLSALENLGRAWFRYGKYEESLATCEEAKSWYEKLNRTQDPAYRRLVGCIDENKANLTK
jgi:tetratricopeptide (TPR) repeat protein